MVALETENPDYLIAIKQQIKLLGPTDGVFVARQDTGQVPHYTYLKMFNLDQAELGSNYWPVSHLTFLFKLTEQVS
jgi:hypothetical protein